jgi:predicted KAP-like P-loop ATPase
LTELQALTIEAQSSLKTKIKSLPALERSLIMTKLLEKASSETNWGTPAVLWGLEALAAEDAAQASRVIAFLGGLPANSLTPGLIVRMRGKPWGNELIEIWQKRADLPATVAKALASKKG